MKFPQEIVDLIFFYIHRLKQDDLIEEMQNSIYLTFVGLIFRTTKSYIRFQYRNFDLLDDLEFYDIHNFENIIEDALPSRYVYSSGFNRRSSYRDIF